MSIQPIIDIFLQALVQLQAVTGNLGISILLFTLIVRSLLLPLSLPTFSSQKKMKALQPELDKLKKKFKDDKKGFQNAQIELYKKYNLNPLSGCLPQVLQIAILLILYRVLVSFLAKGDINGVHIDPQFFWLNLTKPDTTLILPILAAATQLILSVMILPGGEIPDVVPNNSKSLKVKNANKEEEKTAEMADMMQKQMLFVVPLMTGFFATRFPSGLALYWVATTVFSLIQQYFLVGPGGLTTYTRRALLYLKTKTGK